MVWTAAMMVWRWVEVGRWNVVDRGRGKGGEDGDVGVVGVVVNMVDPVDRLIRNVFSFGRRRFQRKVFWLGGERRWWPAAAGGRSGDRWPDNDGHGGKEDKVVRRSRWGQVTDVVLDGLILGLGWVGGGWGRYIVVSRQRRGWLLCCEGDDDGVDSRDDGVEMGRGGEVAVVERAAVCMHTHSQSRNLHHQQHQAPSHVVEPFNLEEPIENPAPPLAPMDDTRTMAQLLEAPTAGYEDAIVVPEITADNFELKHAWRWWDKLLGYKMPRDCLRIIESKSKVRNSRNKPVVAEVTSSTFTLGISFDVAELKDMVVQHPAYQAPDYQAPAPQILRCIKEDFPSSTLKVIDGVMRKHANSRSKHAKSIDQSYGHAFQIFIPNTASTSGTLPSNTVTNPKEDLKGITTRSGVAYKGPTIPTTSSPKVVERETEVTKDTMPPTNNGSTEDVQSPVVPIVHNESISEPVSASMPNQKTSIPFPSRRNDERRREKANDQIEKFYEIFRDLSFEISFTDALMLMPKFASTLKSLIGNKEKLSEMARTPLNENCSAVILNKLPKKLGDPGRFLIPCEFSRINTCNALADLGASINLMPYSVWKNLSLPELTPTCMTLELADRLISEPIDFEPDPRVPLILGRSFLKTSRALIDVYEGEITLRVGREAITFNLDQTSRYTANYNHMTANRIDVVELACEEYSQEVLGFSDVISSGNPTPYFDPIVSTSSPTLTPFGDSDFLLFEEADSFLAIGDDPTSPEVDPTYYDPEGDILLLEAILNSEPLPPLPPRPRKLFAVNHSKILKTFVKQTNEKSSSLMTPLRVELRLATSY
ncbi:reverse transcriptase domain-containing protein [Tanacetum coccineum]|uniref:Reverse transcriptase domain-containing protein n=1 Tax=Tanacetum coccineum TaxID=301880 RepID=A0ABQ5F846_9ASTR